MTTFWSSYKTFSGTILRKRFPILFHFFLNFLIVFLKPFSGKKEEGPIGKKKSTKSSPRILWGIYPGYTENLVIWFVCLSWFRSIVWTTKFIATSNWSATYFFRSMITFVVESQANLLEKCFSCFTKTVRSNLRTGARNCKEWHENVAIARKSRVKIIFQMLFQTPRSKKWIFFTKFIDLVNEQQKNRRHVSCLERMDRGIDQHFR